MPVHASVELLWAMRGYFTLGVEEVLTVLGHALRGVTACNPAQANRGDLVWIAVCANNHNNHPRSQRKNGVPLDTAEDDYNVDCPDCLLLMREIVIEQDPVRWDYLEEHGITFDKKYEPTFRETPW